MDQLVAKESRHYLRSIRARKRPQLAVAVALALTASAWALAPASAGAANTFQFAPQKTYAAGRTPTGVAIADLGNGKPDIVVTNQEDNTASVLIGKGDGTFAPQKAYATGRTPAGVAIADLGNGKPDIVVTNQEDSTVSVLLGKGDGTFEPQKTYATGKTPTGVAIADLGNGKPDIVTANTADNTVSVLIGNGDGSFQPPTPYTTGEAPVAVAIADLNGDKKPDIVTANEKEGTVSVLLGKGDGTFEVPPKNYATGVAPDAVALGDLNHDAKPDIVAADGGANTVSVLLGKGDGTFAAKQDFPTGISPEAVALADLNADAKPDIVTANGGANTVSVLLGRGDGTFAPQAEYKTGKGPVALAVADLNGDGVPDIGTANAAENTVSVLLSTPVLETSASSLSFPNQLFGTKSAAQKVTVTNGGSAPLAIGSVTVSGNFAASGCGGAALAVGASCSLSVTFSPKGYGPLKGEVTIATNAGNKVIKLSGTGLPPPASVTTGPVGEIAGTYVTLTGTVISQGPGAFYFQYGTSSAYDAATPTLPLGSSSTAQALSATLSLSPGTTYHYRLVASNLVGTVYGADQVFTIPPEAPALRLLKHGRLASLLRRGLRVHVSESSRAIIEIKLLVDAQTARAAHLIPTHSRRKAKVIVGSLSVTLAANRGKTVTVKFRGSARSKLARLGRLKLTLIATPRTLNGVAGEPTSVTATVVR
jgi:hypothetical protein